MFILHKNLLSTRPPTTVDVIGAVNCLLIGRTFEVGAAKRLGRPSGWIRGRLVQAVGAVSHVSSKTLFATISVGATKPNLTNRLLQISDAKQGSYLTSIF